MRTVAWVLIAVGLSLSSASCGGKKAASGKPRVAVSIFPLYDVTRRIAGDRIDVILVLPPGKSEHGYDPAPKEIARLEGAKLGFAVGLDLDGWVENIIRTAGGAKVVRLGDKVKTIPIDVEPISEEEAAHDDHDAHEAAGSAKPQDEHEHHHAEVGRPDPHFWLDPTLAASVVDHVADELASIDPAGKDVFAANAKALKAQLAELDGK